VDILLDKYFMTRIDNAKQLMVQECIDCLIITPSSDMKYLCGYAVKGDERFLALVLIPDKEPFIIANSLYEMQVLETPIRDVVLWNDGDDPFKCLQNELLMHHVSPSIIAINSAMPALFSLPLGELYPSSQLRDFSPLLQKLRMYKDRAEMDAMIAATAKADIALNNCIIKGKQWLGKTESEFLAQLNIEMTKLGVRDVGAIVAVGANSAIPHYCTGDTCIENGQCLLVDFGGTFMNYNTDMTRTFYFGTPDKKFVEIYNIVLEACLAGEAAAKIGNKLEDVDFAARNVIKNAGYEKYFIHRTGHGIGIDCHEGPSVQHGEKTVISSGMAFSCEPGIYLPGEFGIRIEEQILIEEDGTTHVLHSFPKHLISIN
jgi:Xaa-Pro dipeptidase